MSLVGAGLTVVRHGRRYELRRGNDAVGEVRRTGFFRPRYEATLGFGRWELRRAMFASSNVVDSDSGREIARLEEGDERGQPLAVEDGRLRPEVDVIRSVRPDGWTYLDPDEQSLLTLRHLGGREGEIAVVEPGERPWPSPDPDAGAALAVAIACMELVARRDHANEQEVNRILT